MCIVHWKIDGHGEGHGGPVAQNIAHAFVEVGNHIYGAGTHWVVFIDGEKEIYN